MNMWLQFLDNWLRGASALRIAGIGAFLAFAAWIIYSVGIPGSGASSESVPQVADAAPLATVVDESDRSDLFSDPVADPVTRAEPSRSEPPSESRPQSALPDLPKPADFQRVILNSRMQGLVGRLKQTLPYLKKGELKRDEWETLRIDLLEGDLGRPLAVDSDGLPQLVELIGQADRLSPLFENLREQYDAVVEMIDTHSNTKPGITFTQKSHDDVGEICNEIISTSTKFEGVILAIRRVVDSSSASDATELTLQEAITQFHADEARQAAEAAVAAKIQAQKNMADQIAAAEREIADSEVRLRLAQLKAEAERIKGEEDVARAEAAKRKEEDEARLWRAKLETDFAQDQAEIQSLLSPFVSRAQYTLTPPNSHLYSGQNAGVSLSAIAKFGALEPTDEGIDAMSQLGQTSYRPLGSFPKYVQSEWRRSPEVRQRLERAQELLLKYGELLVEKGMLEK